MDPRLRAIGLREITLPVVALAMVASGAFGGRAAAVAVPLIVVGSGMFFVGMLLPTLTEFEIRPSGFSAKLRERDEEVRATLDPHTEELMRTAASLAGGPEAARQLLDQALVETYMRWKQAKREGPAEAVRRQLGELAGSSSPAPPGAAEPAP